LAATLFVVGNFLALFVADSAAALTLSGREPWRRALGAIAGVPLLVLGVVLALGNVGLLSGEALVSVVAGLAVILGVLRFRRFARARPPAGSCPATPVPPAVDPVEALLRRSAVVLLGVFAGIIVLRTCALGTGFFSDDLSFHATVPAHWLAGGTFSLVPFHYHHTYHPYNAETLAFWFMSSLHADAFASLAGLYWCALAATAIIAIGAILDHSASTIALGIALFTATPVIVFQTRTFSAVDLAAVSSVLAAVLFAVPSHGEPPPAGRRTDAAYCGLLAGFAAGCKASFAPAACVLFLWWLLSARSAPRLAVRFVNCAVFLAAVVAAGAHWYVRSFMVTGNPLFPAHFGPFEGPMTPEIVRHTQLISWVLAAPWDLDQWWFLARRHLDWPLGMALLALLGYCVALADLRRDRSLRPGRATLKLLLLVLGVTFLCLYPLMPMTGAGYSHRETLRISVRYILAPFAFGLVLFPSGCEPGRRGRELWWGLALLALVTAWPGAAGNLAFMAVASGCAAMVLHLAWERRASIPFSGRWRALPRAVTAGAPVLGALLLLALWTPYKQRATDAELYRYSTDDHVVGESWRSLEALPAGARIAAFETHVVTGHTPAFFYYPVFGRRFNLVPVFVAADGSAGRHLHEQWEAERLTMWEDRPSWDFSRLVANLEQLRVDYVLTSNLGRKGWPPQHEALARSGRARVVREDAYTVLWKLTGSESP
jgi:hypothetical protein